MSSPLDLFKTGTKQLIKTLAAKNSDTVSDSSTRNALRQLAELWHSSTRPVITKFVSQSSDEVLELDNLMDKFIYALNHTVKRAGLLSSARAVSRKYAVIEAHLIKQNATGNVQSSASELIDQSRLTPLRFYVAETIRQINVTYEHQCPDACALMLRRLVEFMLYDFYRLKGREQEIEDSKGATKELKTIINQFIDHSGAKPSTTLKDFLKDARIFGGTAAHNSRVTLLPKDIDLYCSKVNIAVQELRNIVYV